MRFTFLLLIFKEKCFNMKVVNFCIKEKCMYLKKLRIDNNLLPKDIAKVLNIDEKTYLKYENEIEELPINYLPILANFYMTSVDYILGRTEIKHPYPID